VREEGYAIACPAMLIDHVFSEAGPREMFAHELRWSRTVRLVQLGGYLGSVIIHFTPLAMIGAILAGLAPWSVDLMAALFVVRQVQGAILTRLMGGDPAMLWLLPVRDLLSFWVFLAAIGGDRVEWRGARLRVERNGAIATT
jgi:ceramide glucosyltransferase